MLFWTPSANKKKFLDESSSVAEGKGKALPRDKGCQLIGGMGASVGCLRVGEVEGVLWVLELN